MSGTNHDTTCNYVHYECTECGRTYDGYDCGHVHQPLPVSPSHQNGGKPLCDECFGRLGYDA